MNTVVIAILGVGVLLALAGTLRACRRQSGALGGPRTLLWGATRVLALLVLLRLGWQVLLARVPELAPSAGPPPRLLVLTDVSASMAAQAGDGGTRAALAASLLQRLETLAASAGQPLALVPWVFAEGVAPAGQDPAPDPRASQLTRALSETLTREQAAAVLLLSDGASSDGPPPRLWRDWAANRGVGLYAIGPWHEPVPPDLRLTPPVLAPRNPEQVQVTLHATGLDPARAWELQLSVDGRELQRQRFTGNGHWPLTLPLPELAPGWHELAVTLPPLPGELTTRNNLALAIFQVAPPAGILFLYDQPRLDDAQARRFWQARLGERLASYAVSDPALAKVPVAAVRLVILGAVAPQALPPALLAAIRGGQVHGLWLAGPHLGDWAAALPEFPVRASQGLLAMAGRKLPPALPRATMATPAPWLAAPGQAGLTLHHLQGVTAAGDAWVPLLATAGESWPLLLADRAERPRRVVWTAEGSWKWLMQPDPRARQASEQFWQGLADWLLAGDDDSQELLLDWRANAAGELLASISPRQADWLPRLQAVTLSLASGRELPRQVPLKDLRDGAYQWRQPAPATRPLILWASAQAKLDERQLHSPRQPLLLADDPGEWQDPAPRPELLRQWARGDGHFALANDADEVFARLLHDLAQRDPPQQRRRRQPTAELWLAGLLALLLGLDWWRERRAAHALGR